MMESESKNASLQFTSPQLQLEQSTMAHQLPVQLHREFTYLFPFTSSFSSIENSWLSSEDSDTLHTSNDMESDTVMSPRSTLRRALNPVDVNQSDAARQQVSVDRRLSLTTGSAMQRQETIDRTSRRLPDPPRQLPPERPAPTAPRLHSQPFSDISMSPVDLIEAAAVARHHFEKQTFTWGPHETVPEFLKCTVCSHPMIRFAQVCFLVLLLLLIVTCTVLSA